MMSMSRRACVTQITAVRLTNTTRNAPKVVRRIYWLKNPIRSIVPRSGNNRTPRAASPPDAKHFKLKSQPRQLYLDRPTKWPGNGKAVEHAQQNVNAGSRAGCWLRRTRPLLRYKITAKCFQSARYSWENGEFPDNRPLQPAEEGAIWGRTRLPSPQKRNRNR